MERIFPPLPQKGERVALFAPSYWVDEETVKIAWKTLSEMGFVVVVPEQLQYRQGQVGGTAEQRAHTLHQLFQDEEIKAVFAVRGGYGALQLLDHLDYDLLKAHPTAFIGSSDSTALLNAIYARTGLVGYHGPMFGSMPHKEHLDPQTVSSLQVVLNGGNHVNLDSEVHPVQRAKSIGGTLIGGNARVFDQLIGTPYFPQDDSIILMLEDVNEKVNELDKNFLHLKHAGILPYVQGVIIGEEKFFDDNAEQPFGMAVSEVLQRYFPNDIPLVCNVSCGHGKKILTTPIGAEVILDVTAVSSHISWE